nr:hypothetical protein [Pseudooceanicola spongiae]
MQVGMIRVVMRKDHGLVPLQAKGSEDPPGVVTHLVSADNFALRVTDRQMENWFLGPPRRRRRDGHFAGRGCDAVGREIVEG